LWRLAPAYDPEGGASADFMMLIPRLSQRGPAFVEHATGCLREVCDGFGERVLFADLNFRTGAVWISVRAQPGLCAEVARAVRQKLPQALTIGGQLGAMNAVPALAAPRWRVWISRIPRLGGRLRALCLPGSDSR
jgi:hypothetical protein